VFTIWQDLRYGARTLTKNPGFALLAVVTLALGIGANTAIFSVIHAVLLKPLPYPDAERLTWVWLDNRREGIREDITSYPNFEDWRGQNKVFEAMAGVRDGRFNLTGVGEPEELKGASVSANFFALVGVNPARGRGFAPEEEQEGRDGVVVLSHGLWRRRFGASESIVGQKISLSGRSFDVVGVMPPGFEFPAKVELWKPLAPNAQLRSSRNSFWLPVVGRLKPGVTRASAQADMDVIAGRLEQQYPQSNQGYGVNVVPIHEQMVGRLRPTLLVLLAAVACVLLIACANVANLLLVRASVRQKEIALRAALGASRWRVARQLLTESVLLAGLGGALGLLLAHWGLDGFLALVPEDLPRASSIGVDGRVLLFTSGLSLLTGVVFGLVPAWQASKVGLIETLKEGGRGEGAGGVGGRRLRRALVVAEIALALVLLAGAGLMIKSLWRLQQVNPGFNPDRLISMRLSLPRTKYPEGPQVAAFFQQLGERLRAVPGVQAVGATSSVMMEKLHNSSTFSVEGRPAEPQGQRLELPFDAVSNDYFQTMGVPVVRGRAFNEHDKRDGLPVAIINEAMARRYWPNEDPVGKRFTFGDPGPNAQWLTIVGVVGDVKRLGLDTPVRIETYLPHSQATARAMEVVVRTADNPLAMARTLRSAVWEIDKDLPVAEVRTVEQAMSERAAPRRFGMLLLALFAALALVLAAVGIYGVMSYSVAQRTHEIGIRMALGAGRRDVMKMVVGQGMKLALVGVGVGLAGAFALTRLMAGLLFGVSASDPLTFAGVAALLLSLALLACLVPARRAVKVDPMVALRYE
jgi:putative ABC transport system permease protein